MHKWSRKKTQFSVFLLLCLLFTFSSLLPNDDTTRRGSNNLRDLTSARSSIVNTSLDANESTSYIKKSVSGSLDWSSTCSSTRKHKGSSRIMLEEYQGQRQRQQDGCNLWSGFWVFDNLSYPLYDEASCPYMSDQLACTKHGRPDSDYQKWRWQPHGCNLKRWNATEMLQKLKGKRLMFVGDSLNRGQWISMICLVQSIIPAPKKSISPNAALTVFRAEEYNASIEFLWAPFLVESNSDDPVNHRLSDRIIRPDSVLKHASKWKHADILVFNSYLWWRSGPEINLLWSDDHGTCEEASAFEAMKLAFETWAGWIDSNVDPLKQKVFFVTVSPTHLRSREWNSGTEGNCFKETRPISKPDYWGSGSDQSTMRMVDRILHQLGSKVTVLNITQLSEYRRDGHPSVYRKFWEKFTPQQLANPASYADCIHWCLPGVPDTWNELLFNSL